MPASKLEVLTLREAASYLRVSDGVLDQLASQGAVPARKLGEEWRFLKSALVDWLGGPLESRRGSKERVLKVAGAWKDDPTLDKLLAKINRPRGRVLAKRS